MSTQYIRYPQNGSGGGISIGGTVTGGTPGSVLFIGPTGLIAQDNPDFTYDGTTNHLSVAGLIDTKQLLLNGATSGTLTINPAAVTTSYSITMPATQGAASTTLQNNGSGTLSWVTVSSGANTSLSNLSSVAVNTSLLPGVDNSIDLGSNVFGWRRLYAFNIYEGGTNTLAINANARSLVNSSGTLLLSWSGSTPAVNGLTLNGSTSGTLTHQAAAITTPYTVTWPSAQGGVSTFLQNNGSGTLSWATVTSTAPAGANTQIQFNDSGIFGGDADFTWKKTTNHLFINGKVVDASDISSLDAVNRQLQAADASVSADWDGRNLIDSTSNISIDWENRLIYDSTGAQLISYSGPDIDASIHKIINVVDPTSAQDVATKAYVDSGTGNAANKALSNLTATSIGQDLLPVSSALVALGSSTKTWSGIHLGSEVLYGSISGNVTINPANTTTSYTLILPSSQGSSNTVLTNNGSGTLSWAAVSTSSTPNKETFVLSGTDITNQFIDLAHVAQTNSILFQVKGSGDLLEGASYDYSVNYTGGAGGNTRITFLNDLATGGAAALIATDVVQINYIY